jgi:pimeloyl-ACP methyl ester carboxylesterase
MRRGYFDAPFGQAHYREIGAGAPLLLLHQSPLSSAQFDPALPLLANAGFHCVAVDLPGMGMSDAVQEGATIGDFATIIPAAMKAFGWGQANILGHHTGAAVAAWHGARHPDTVLKLILNGVPLLSAEERAFFASFKFGPLVAQEDGAHLLNAWNTRLKATPGWRDVPAMSRHTIQGLHRGETSWMAFPAVIGYDMAEDLAKLPKDTLFFTNSGEDLYASTQRAYALRPDCRYGELEGGTHDIVDEFPESWSAHIIAFLKETP